MIIHMEVHCKLLIRSRAHLRRRSREVKLPGSKPRTKGKDGASNITHKVGESSASENRLGNESLVGVRESERVQKRKQDPDIVYY